MCARTRNRRPPGWPGCVVAVSLIAAVGCNRPDGSASSSPGTSAATIREISPADLPPLDEYLPPLDHGRIEAAPPEDWRIGSRAAGYVVRFLAAGADPYPMILISAQDAPHQAGVSRETAERFAARIRHEASAPDAQPIAIGSRVGAIYRKRGKDPKGVHRIVERLFVVTVLGHRRYAIELRTGEDQIEAHQDALFAVAAGMRPAVSAGEVKAGGGEPAPAAEEKETSPSG